MTNESKKLFNLDELNQMSNGDEKFVQEMIDVFIRTTKQGVNDMKEAFKEKQFARIGSAVHKLAPPCRHMGAHTLLSTLKKIDNNIKESGDVNALEALLIKATHEANCVINDLKSVTKNH